MTMNYKFNKTEDYNQLMHDYINGIMERDLSQEECIAEYDDLLECFIKAIGERPKSSVLNRITNSILKKDLSDNSTNKRTKTEYPFLSINQIKRRAKKETLFEDDVTLNYYASDGKHYPPVVQDKKPYMEMSEEEKKSVADFYRYHSDSNGLRKKGGE